MKDEKKQLLNVQVLIADDSSDNLLLMRHILVNEGAEVEGVANGQEAVDKMFTKKFDIVLMDIEMPVLDGFGACEELRKRGFLQPIIALTAHDASRDPERYHQAGFTDYLMKPFEFQTLIDSIHKQLKS